MHIYDHLVAVFDANVPNLPSQQLLICRPEAGTVVIATDRAYLDELLKRRKDHASEMVISK